MIKQNHTLIIAQTLSFADVENAESQDLQLSYLKCIGRKEDEMTEKKLRKTPLAVQMRENGQKRNQAPHTSLTVLFNQHFLLFLAYCHEGIQNLNAN